MSLTRGFSTATTRKRPLLSPINLRHGPRIENTSHAIPTQWVYWCADCCLATSYNIRPMVRARIAGCLSSRCLAMCWYVTLYTRISYSVGCKDNGSATIYDLHGDLQQIWSIIIIKFNFIQLQNILYRWYTLRFVDELLNSILICLA
jgi:hypothetical protein